MDWSGLQSWLNTTPFLVMGLELFVATCAAALVGTAFRRFQKPRKSADDKESSEGQETFVVSSVLGLLALLLGFTFSLAVDRFDARRLLVLDEANAIGTAYLRAQLLPEPHRARMSDILVRYTDNRIALAKARPDQVAPYLAKNDALLTDAWAATSAAFDVIKGLDFSSTYVDSVNHMIDLDASRKAARGARVPVEVFVVLFVYFIMTAGVLGHTLQGLRGRLAAGFLLALLTLSLVLIIDVDRPTTGGVIESQAPMEALRRSLAAQPPPVFDRWRSPEAVRTPATSAFDKVSP